MREKRVSIETTVSWWQVFIGIIICIVFLTLVGSILSLRDILFLPGTATASGTVISCQLEYNNKTGNYCHTIIGFDTQSSEHVTFETSMDGSTQAGDRVAVRYQLLKPEDARIDSILPDLTFAGFSSGLLVVGLCILVYWQRQRARASILKHKGLAPKKQPEKRRGKRRMNARSTHVYRRYGRG